MFSLCLGLVGSKCSISNSKRIQDSPGLVAPLPSQDMYTIGVGGVGCDGERGTCTILHWRGLAPGTSGSSLVSTHHDKITQKWHRVSKYLQNRTGGTPTKTCIVLLWIKIHFSDYFSKHFIDISFIFGTCFNEWTAPALCQGLTI